MKNPWLDIPLADYEGHMALPNVAQSALLADIFEGALSTRAPASVVILGCAGGNGFDRIDPVVTKRVIGIDINADYIAAARERFQQHLPGLELITADLQAGDLKVEPVELVFAALLLEYVDADVVLKAVHRLLKPNGCLMTVVKLPHADSPTVTPSPFTSLQALSPCLLSPEKLRERAAAHGLTEVESVRVTSLGGKAFQVQTLVALPPQDRGFTIAAAQSSSVKGDIAQNIRRHAEFVVRAVEHQAHVVVFPELSLTGYEPTLAAELAIDARDGQLAPLQELSDQLDVTIIAGCPIRSHVIKPYIGAFIIRPQLPIEVYRKRFLHPGEELHFISADDVVACDCHSRCVGIAICADISNPRHPADASQQNATIYAAGLAFTPRGIAEAEAAMSGYARQYGFLAVMANYASATGGFPMAGKSAIWDESGTLVAQAAATGESLVLARSTSQGWVGGVVTMNEQDKLDLKGSRTRQRLSKMWDRHPACRHRHADLE